MPPVSGANVRDCHRVGVASEAVQQTSSQLCVTTDRLPSRDNAVLRTDTMHWKPAGLLFYMRITILVVRDRLYYIDLYLRSVGLYYIVSMNRNQKDESLLERALGGAPRGDRTAQLWVSSRTGAAASRRSGVPGCCADDQAPLHSSEGVFYGVQCLKSMRGLSCFNKST